MIPKEREDVEVTLLLLQLRNAIAAREFNTAAANREANCGDNWLSDHYTRDLELEAEINNLIKVVKTRYDGV